MVYGVHMCAWVQVHIYECSHKDQRATLGAIAQEPSSCCYYYYHHHHYYYYYRERVQVREQLSGLGSFLPWSILRIELKLSGLCGSCFYPLNHLTSHHAKLFTWLQGLELRKPFPYWVVSLVYTAALPLIS